MRERDKKALSLKCHDTVLVYRKYRNILLGDKRSNSVIPSSLNCTLFIGKDLHHFIHLNLKQFLKKFIEKLLNDLTNQSKNDIISFDSKLMKMASSIVVKYICCLVNSSLVKCTVLNGKRQE